MTSILSSGIFAALYLATKCGVRLPIR